MMAQASQTCRGWQIAQIVPATLSEATVSGMFRWSNAVTQLTWMSRSLHADCVRTQTLALLGEISTLMPRSLHSDPVRTQTRALLGEISTLRRPWKLIKPIPVTVSMVDTDCIASFVEADLHTSGDSPDDAILNLKSMLMDLFQILSAHKPTELGPGPKKQLDTLKQFVRKR